MTTSGIHHLGLTVADLDVTTNFFVDCLGWKVVREVPEYPAKFVSDGSAVFTLWQGDDSAMAFDRRANVGLHHVAIQVPDEQALASLFQQVHDYPGVTVEFAPQPLGGGPSRHCMFLEPGGIRIELTWAP